MYHMKFNYDNFFSFKSRRSSLFVKHGAVGASQPLAAEAGLSILKEGGNAADAAVATAAMLNVVEPMSTGVGGDCFCLFYDNSQKKVFGLNGSGRSPKELTVDYIFELGIKGTSIPSSSPLSITVPGTVAGWIDTLSRFGTMKIDEVLAPAIKTAKEGFPVSPLISMMWKLNQIKLKKSKFGGELLIGTKAPTPGQIFENHNLARVFQEIAENGKSGFYKGWVADAIVKVILDSGGVLTHADLISHASDFVEPISTNYRGVDVYEIPPNGQGITVLLALNILEGYNTPSMNPKSSIYYHLLIESLRLAFADTRYFVADSDMYDIPVKQLLSKAYASERRTLINDQFAIGDLIHGSPTVHSDTVYLATADAEGNACSFINSNYEAFGTGIVPEGTGFALQNRGSCFTLISGHPNVLAPQKRPYHTIIPGMALKNNELYACFGIMGGYNQPQAHVQVLSNLIDFNYDPQVSLDSPRFTILGGTASGTIALEEGIDTQVIDNLRRMGHTITVSEGIGRNIFGNGQIIMRDPENEVYIAGCDPRSDGCVLGF